MIKINQYTTKFSIFYAGLAVVLSLLFIGNNALAKEINLINTVKLVNESRQANGLPKLFINPTLIKVASDKANDMITHHYFAHTSPQGISPWYWFRKNNYNYEYAGENLAINYRTAEEQHRAWMNSPTHRRNILNPNYTEIGIATAHGYIDGQPAFITVQVFGKPQQTNSLIGSANNNSVQGKYSAVNPADFSFNYGEIYYLKEANLPHSNKPLYEKNSSSTSLIVSNSKIIKTIQHKQKEIIWLTILILAIIITRDLVLNSIATYPQQRHSVTNLILLLMLWSILISL